MAIGSATTSISGPYISDESIKYLDALEKREKSSSIKISQDMGKDQFLHILLTQLSNQNPLDPMQDKDFIAQMAQFSSLEEMQNLNKTMTTVATDIASVKSAIDKNNTTLQTGTNQDKGLLEGIQTTLDRINETLNIQVALMYNASQAAEAIQAYE